MGSLRNPSTRTVYLTMKRLAVALLCALVAGCATPVPSATPLRSPALSTSPSLTPSQSSSPSVGIVFSCPSLPIAGPASPPASPTLDCSTAETAVLAAVTAPGLPVRSVTILLGGFFCGLPFAPEGILCPRPNSGPAAYVTFVGTDMVAALLIETQLGGAVVVATIVASEIPPAGWSMP